jgi:formate dehydrogenase beta subunit
VCPENLIRLVPLSQLVADDSFLASAAAEFGVNGDELRALTPEDLDALGGVMMKDETTCIRCAMCATRCPTHAITMKHFQFTRECVTVPAPNPKVLYQ